MPHPCFRTGGSPHAGLGRNALVQGYTALTCAVSRSEAIQVLQQCIEAGGPASDTGSGAWRALLQYNLAVLLAESGRVDDAMRAAGAALEACSGTDAAVSVSVLELDGGDAARQHQRRQQLVTLCLVLLGLLLSSRYGYACMAGCV